jgi:hypothetical protein
MQDFEIRLHEEVIIVSEIARFKTICVPFIIYFFTVYEFARDISDTLYGFICWYPYSICIYI